MVEEGTKNGDLPDVETLTEKLVSSIRSKNPGLAEKEIPDVLSAIGRQINCLTKNTQDASYRSFLIFSTGLLLAQIKENYHPSGSFPVERSGRTVSSQDYSIENGSRLNSLAVDYWNEFKRFRLDTGVFTAGFESSNGALYARGLKNFLDADQGPFQLSLDGALAAFSVLPSSEGEFNDRVMAGGIASTNIFGGIRHDFSSSVGLRSGAQLTPQVWTGMNLPVQTHDPLKAGGSAVFSLGQNVYASAGAEAQFDLYPRNIQDPMSWRPNYTGVAPFIAVTSPSIDFESSVLMTGTGKEFRAKIGLPFSFGDNHHFLASVEGFITVDGSPVYPAGAFLNISYTPNIGPDQGVVASANIRTAGKSNSSSSSFFVQDNSHYDEQSAEDAYQASIPHFRKGWVYECSQENHRCVFPRWGRGSLENCNSSDGINYECYDNYQASSTRYTLRVSESTGKARVVDIKAVIYDPIMRSLFESASFEDFVNRTRSSSLRISTEDKLTFLQYITAKLYQTYDEKGLNVLNGGGSVNNTSIEDMYQGVVKKIMHPENQDKITVCRGIARFATALAHEWGWEGYSAAVSAGDMGHVVSVVKPPELDNYQVISWGNRSYVGSNTILQALENFSLAEDYPPQLQYQLYDHEGNYIRAVNTSLGNQLFSRTVTPDRLKAYLRGK